MPAAPDIVDMLMVDVNPGVDVIAMLLPAVRVSAGIPAFVV
jgi:hypothetical protein